MRLEKDDSFKQLMKFRLITQKKIEISIRNHNFNKRGLHNSIFFFLKKKKERRGSEEVRKYNYN